MSLKDLKDCHAASINAMSKPRFLFILMKVDSKADEKLECCREFCRKLLMEMGLSFWTIPFAGLWVAITKAQVGRDKGLDAKAAASEDIPIESCGPGKVMRPIKHLCEILIVRDDWEWWYRDVMASLEVMSHCMELTQALGDDDTYLLEQLHLAFEMVRDELGNMSFVEV